MTAIVGVLNSQGIAIAADSAVTVVGNNVKKVYNRSNKIFTLSKFHPVGIAVYNHATYLGMPLETLVKVYRKKLEKSSFETVEQYKTDFLAFLQTQLIHVSDDYKRSNFFGFCNPFYITLISRSIKALKDEDSSNAMNEQNEEKLKGIFSNVLEDYINDLASRPKARYVHVSFADYNKFYENELKQVEDFVEERISNEIRFFKITKLHRQTIRKMLFELINIEFISEGYCGLVFFGFGELELYPSSQEVLVGSPIADNIRFRIFDPVKITPGEDDSNILPYAQGDVALTVLTGVDPNYKNEVMKSVRASFDKVSDQVSDLIKNDDLAKQISDATKNVADTLIQGLEDYQQEKITGPLLDILAHMGKEDMSELAESLVNITSLKRKFTSTDSMDESVGGPVDVAIVTKGDGFIWMKRKHYFDIADNQSFSEKYLK